MATITLLNNGDNANTVRFGDVSVIFSYEAAIGYTHRGVSVLNPEYVGFSRTTSKHATQAGLKGSPVAASGEAFAADLAALIAAQR